MSGFRAGEQQWEARLDGLRNVIRQEVIARQLARHADREMSVLDVGCGQGTQALRLAARGCQVTGVDPSARLLRLFRAGAEEAQVAVEAIEAALEDLDDCLAARQFDLVCAHGLLMYLDDRPGAILALSQRVAPGGRLSVTFRNGHALAMRPGLRGDWHGALAAFDRQHYTNELGVEATVARLDEVEADLQSAGLDVEAWYGVRVFNDAIANETEVPADDELSALLDAEDLAGRTDPYRWMGSQLHVVAR